MANYKQSETTLTLEELQLVRFVGTAAGRNIGSALYKSADRAQLLPKRASKQASVEHRYKMTNMLAHLFLQVMEDPSLADSLAMMSREARAAKDDR